MTDREQQRLSEIRAGAVAAPAAEPAVGAAPLPLADDAALLASDEEYDDDREVVPNPPPPATLSVFAWDGHRLIVGDTTAALKELYHGAGTTVWVDVESATPQLLGEIAACLDLHPLVAEDIVERNQRAKIEQAGGATQIVMFALERGEALTSSELDLVLGPRFLLSSHDATWRPQEAPQFRQGIDRVLSGGPDLVLWAVMDHLVDSYFPVFDRIGDEIDQLQSDVIDRPSRYLVERLLQVRNDLLTIRHAVSPQRELLNQLTNRSNGLVHEDRVIYFRDIYDHLVRLTEELDSFREQVTTTMDVYLTTVNNDLSEVMKRLTAVTVVLAGVGAVGGIFGASEASAAFSGQAGAGFWVVVVLSVALGAGALMWFKRSGWL